MRNQAPTSKAPPAVSLDNGPCGIGHYRFILARACRAREGYSTGERVIGALICQTDRTQSPLRPG